MQLKNLCEVGWSDLIVESYCFASFRHCSSVLYFEVAGYFVSADERSLDSLVLVHRVCVGNLLPPEDKWLNNPQLRWLNF